MPRSGARATVPGRPPGTEPRRGSRLAAAGVIPAGDGRRPGIGPEFGVDPVHVVFHGLFREHELCGDRPVRVPLSDKGHDLRFARRKAQRARVARHAGGRHLASAHPVLGNKSCGGMLPKPAPARARAGYWPDWWEPDSRFLGTGRSWFRSLNSYFALAESHSTA